MSARGTWAGSSGWLLSLAQARGLCSQRASISHRCVEQQGCNSRPCNTECLHCCSPGCAEFPAGKGNCRSRECREGGGIPVPEQGACSMSGGGCAPSLSGNESLLCPSWPRWSAALGGNPKLGTSLGRQHAMGLPVQLYGSITEHFTTFSPEWLCLNREAALA